MTLKNGFARCSLFALSASGWKDLSLSLSLRFPAKENPSKGKASCDWPIALQYDVKAKYRMIFRKFSGMKFFHPSVCLTNQKPRTFVSVR